MKLDLDIPYLTKLEATLFKKSRSKGAISAFRVRLCEGILNMDDFDKPTVACMNEVPKVDDENGKPLKRYCSKECYTNMENPTDVTDQEEDDW